MNAPGETLPTFEAGVQALNVILQAVSGGALLQLGGLGCGDSKVYGFLEAPEAGGITIEVSGADVAETLRELAKRWQDATLTRALGLESKQ